MGKEMKLIIYCTLYTKVGLPGIHRQCRGGFDPWSQGDPTCCGVAKPRAPQLLSLGPRASSARDTTAMGSPPTTAREGLSLQLEKSPQSRGGPGRSKDKNKQANK